MATVLVKLEIQDQVMRTQRAGDEVKAQQVLAEAALRVHLILTPDTNYPDTEKLGFVDLRIDCKPRDLPDLTKSEMVAWIAKTLTKML